MLMEEKHLNDTIDFSFEYEFRGKGKWTRDHSIAVPDEIGRGVNADNVSLTNKTDFVKIQDQISAINLEEPDV